MPNGILLNLNGTILVAMSGLNDRRFESAVVFLCAHSKKGAMGLIINQPIPNMFLGELFSQSGLHVDDVDIAERVYFGGPVEKACGFVLHSPDYESDVETLKVSDKFGMTTTKKVYFLGNSERARA